MTAATGATPEFLSHLAAGPRVTIRRGSAPLKTGKCIVYWMQRAQRGLDNPALDLAVTIANELKLPVIAYFSVIANYPNANLRHSTGKKFDSVTYIRQVSSLA